MAHTQHEPEIEHLPSGMDYQAHEATYRGFMRLVKWSVILLAIVAVALYFVIQP